MTKLNSAVLKDAGHVIFETSNGSRLLYGLHNTYNTSERAVYLIYCLERIVSCIRGKDSFHYTKRLAINYANETYDRKIYVIDGAGPGSQGLRIILHAAKPVNCSMTVYSKTHAMTISMELDSDDVKGLNKLSDAIYEEYNYGIKRLETKRFLKAAESDSDSGTESESEIFAEVAKPQRSKEEENNDPFCSHCGLEFATPEELKSRDCKNCENGKIKETGKRFPFLSFAAITQLSDIIDPSMIVEEELPRPQVENGPIISTKPQRNEGESATKPLRTEGESAAKPQRTEGESATKPQRIEGEGANKTIKTASVVKKKVKI
jgi:hypothetical protein